jgi:O-acetyl-ADP-ribose deacetylase (regulator of RNase III)
MLENCYRNSLDLAKEHGIHSIAFSAISTGVYGYPLEEAVPIAVAAVRQWLAKNPEEEMEVIFSCFNETIYQMYQEELGE